MPAEDLSQTRTTRWPQPLAGLRGIRWADVPREVSAGVTLAANPQLPPLLRRYHLLELIGENRLYPTNRHAVAALRQKE